MAIDEEEKLKMGMNILVKDAYKACKPIITKEGTLAAARCMCEKLTNEAWQKEQLKYGVYWTYPIV